MLYYYVYLIINKLFTKVTVLLMENNAQNNESSVIFGRNPVLEAIKSGREIDRLYIAHGTKGGSVTEIIARCSQKGI